MNYKVYQGSELKQTVTSKTAVMNGLQPNRTYEFGVQPNDGNRDGTKVATSVTTRGIRFNIPKTMTVGSTITLRYEEYPLGIVPIGNEPSGMFGGGNKQNLSAKVVSTANGSSVVEVAGNVIDVGNKNLWDRSKAVSGYLTVSDGNVYGLDAESLVSDVISVDEKQTYIYSTEVVPTITNKLQTWDAYQFFDSNKAPLGNRNVLYGNTVTLGTSQHTEWVIKAPIGASFIRIGSRYLEHGTAKLEVGSVPTPYASFVDGDTFTAQPDGTCALFSEYKALYY